ncbi:hypothetical protein BJX64DRAFT_293036 [Aspergillus heterothallicus]
MPYNTTACVAAAISLYVLSICSLLLRCYTRLILLRNFSADDYIAVLATAINSALAISYILGVFQYDLGTDVPRESSQSGLKVDFLGELFYFISTYLAKLSFVFTLFRIVSERTHAQILYLLMISGGIITVVAWFWFIFLCTPVQYFWEQVGGPDIPGSCKPLSSLWVLLIIHPAWVLLADITLGLVIPVLILWNLNMRRKVKASVYILLGVGFVIATIIRITYVPRKAAADPLIEHHGVVFWSTIEATITIICMAGVTIKPLIVCLGGFSASRSPTNLGDTYATYTTLHRGRLVRVQSKGKGQSLESASDTWVMMAPVERGSQQRSEGSLRESALSRENSGILVRTEISKRHGP